MQIQEESGLDSIHSAQGPKRLLVAGTSMLQAQLLDLINKSSRLFSGLVMIAVSY